jgi:hypothetical protein
MLKQLFPLGSKFCSTVTPANYTAMPSSVKQ